MGNQKVWTTSVCHSASCPRERCLAFVILCTAFPHCHADRHREGHCGEEGQNEVFMFHVGECIIEEIETDANPPDLRQPYWGVTPLMP